MAGKEVTYEVFPRRNPCPCGSGKKFKNCCEDSVRFDVTQMKRAEDNHPGTLTTMRQAIEQEIAARQGDMK